LLSFLVLSWPGSSTSRSTAGPGRPVHSTSTGSIGRPALPQPSPEPFIVTESDCATGSLSLAATAGLAVADARGFPPLINVAGTAPIAASGASFLNGRIHVPWVPHRSRIVAASLLSRCRVTLLRYGWTVAGSGASRHRDWGLATCRGGVLRGRSGCVPAETAEPALRPSRVYGHRELAGASSPVWAASTWRDVAGRRLGRAPGCAGELCPLSSVIAVNSQYCACIW
jgi:hypothetical protein